MWNNLRVFLQRLEMGVEPDLGNERGHHGAADYCGEENRVLILIDDVVGKPEQRRDRAEGKPRPANTVAAGWPSSWRFRVVP